MLRLFHKQWSMLFSIFIFYSGVHVLMRKSMQLFGQNMLFMDKVLNSETLKMEDHHSELMPEVTLEKIKDFSHYLLQKPFQSRCIYYSSS